jgi:mono/diheme cytochrome c family protein
MSSLGKRIAITLAVLSAPFILGLLITYQVIDIEWISTMEIQPSFRPMEEPLPLPANSVPVEGIAYLPDAGAPANPIPSSQESLQRGQELYAVNCALCHGEAGKGDGPVAKDLIRKPANLTGANAAILNDGEVFIIITNGIKISDSRITMPDLRENLAVADRWDVVNYLRSLQQK